MAFPHYWVAGFMNSMGWPRKEGKFFNKKWVVDSEVADRTLDQLIATAIQIGADAPDVGIKLLVSQFDDKNWDDMNELESFVDFLHQASTEPYLQGRNDIFQNVASKVPWEAFGHESIAHQISTRFISALWLGLTKPQQVEERINTRGRSQYEETWRNAGLGISAHSREELLQDALHIVSAYEEEREELKEAGGPIVNYINGQRSSKPDVLE